MTLLNEVIPCESVVTRLGFLEPPLGFEGFDSAKACRCLGSEQV